MRQIHVCLFATIPPALTWEVLIDDGGDDDDVVYLLGGQAEAQEGQVTCPWS